jgi:hypothetical protein
MKTFLFAFSCELLDEHCHFSTCAQPLRKTVFEKVYCTVKFAAQKNVMNETCCIKRYSIRVRRKEG